MVHVKYLFLLPVLYLAGSFPAFASPPDLSGTGNEPAGNSGNELPRLIEISTRLAELNGKLRTELADSRKNSQELLNTLGESRKELEDLRNELENLRRASTGLLSSAETSSQESEALKSALTKAESSLRNLEASFSAYRMTAEGRIARLEKSRTVLKYGIIIGAVLAIGGWTAFAVSAGM
jgi:predicted RNase H-like nuclease (RuvC/YqgF family)